MNCSTPGSSVRHCLPEFAQAHVHLVSDAIQPSLPLLSPSPPALNLSQYKSLFQWVSSYASGGQSIGSFSFSISPSNEYLGLISLRIERFDLCAVQGTLKGLLQYHNLKASILWCSAFFMVQLTHLYITIGKTIALHIRTFVGKVMCLLFNVLSRYIIAFLPRRKYLLISWLQSPSLVTLEPKKIF